MLSLRTILTGVRNCISVVAEYTETKCDEQLVAAIDALLSSDALLDYLQNLLNQPADALSIVAPPLALESELQRRQLDWTKLVEMLPVILTLVRGFLGK